MKKFITSCVAIVTLVIGGTIGAAASAYIIDAVSGSNTLVSGCVLRFPDGKPTIHANGAHVCAGVNDVRIDQHGQVEVSQTLHDPARYPILFAMCQADETLGGSRGIICGATGGTDTTRFRLYDTELGRQLDLTQQSDRNRVAHSNANLWVGWFHLN